MFATCFHFFDLKERTNKNISNKSGSKIGCTELRDKPLCEIDIFKSYKTGKGISRISTEFNMSGIIQKCSPHKKTVNPPAGRLTKRDPCN